MVRISLRLGFFFQRGGVVERIVAADLHTPIHRQRHDQDQTAQPVGCLELGIFQLKSPTLKVREGRFNYPPRAVIPHRGLGRLTVHRDNPRLLMPRFMQNPQVRRHAAVKQPDLGQVAFADPAGQLARGRLTEAGIDRQVTFQPQTILPAVLLQPGK